MRISDWSSDVCSSDLPSRTLVLTDLIENIEPRRVKNILYRWLIRLGGAADPDGKAPRDMQWSFRKHRAEVHRAAERMIGWAPERLLLAHRRWYGETRQDERREGNGGVRPCKSRGAPV